MFHKYKKIHITGHLENKEIFDNPKNTIYVEEKMDGANFRFMIKNEIIIFGSRNQSIGDSTTEIGGNWKRCVTHIKTKLEGKNLTKYENKIFYGECMVSHSISYDWETIPPFLGFDILDLQTEKFIGYPTKTEMFDELGLTTVPVLTSFAASNAVSEMLQDEKIPQSKYGTVQAEGVVYKNYDAQIFSKQVTEKFKEVNKKTFGTTKKQANDDTERLVSTYCTNARIDKMIFKMVNDGETLDMPMMHTLPTKILQDIYEENWNEICMSTWSINFRNVRKQVSNRCVHVLKQMITNTVLNKTG